MLNAFAKLETIMKSKVLQTLLKRLEQVETRDVSTSFRERSRLTTRMN
jgi:hypothetical protein